MQFTPADVYVRHTGTAKGRAVYAARPFRAGEVVEYCPVVLFDGHFKSVPNEVRQLLFNWGFLAKVRDTHCLALGYGSLYNHNNPANMRYEADLERPALCFIAVRDVALDEELTVNYNAVGGAHHSDDDTWFDRMGIEPIVSD